MGIDSDLDDSELAPMPISDFKVNELLQRDRFQDAVAVARHDGCIAGPCLVALWQTSARPMTESKPGRWGVSLVIHGPRPTYLRPRPGSSPGPATVAGTARPRDNGKAVDLAGSPG